MTTVEQRRADQAAIRSWWDQLNKLASEWDLETVKHLVVLNAAGIAGSATLIAGSNKLTPDCLGPITLTGYGIGVVLAVLNMHLAATSFQMMSIELQKRIARSTDLTVNRDELFEELTSGKRVNVIGQICGWLSALLAITSTIALGIGLVK